MDDLSGARRLRQPAYNSGLHLTAVISVITGAALLAVAAFLLSYARIHEIALTARVSPSLAALYPLIFDMTLVIACVAALALRGAPWWMRYSAVLIIIILLAVVAAGEALHSAGVNLPRRPTAAALAAVPWALFLIGFGLGLLVLRYQRRVRAMARAAYPGEVPKAAHGSGAEKLSLDELTSRSALWITDSDPQWHSDSDPQWNTDADPEWNADADPQWNTDSDPEWNTDSDPTNVRIVPVEPGRSSPSQQSGTQDASLTPPLGNGHRHGRGHGHQHRSGPLA
jgi:hypothetical protein